MLFGDGKGPLGHGLGSGRGMKTGRGGRMGGSSLGAGPGGCCVCPQCGTKIPHQQGTPCYAISCPQCGTKMTRG